jgi:hypothetical protein
MCGNGVVRWLLAGAVVAGMAEWTAATGYLFGNHRDSGWDSDTDSKLGSHLQGAHGSFTRVLFAVDCALPATGTF